MRLFVVVEDGAEYEVGRLAAPSAWFEYRSVFFKLNGLREESGGVCVSFAAIVRNLSIYSASDGVTPNASANNRVCSLLPRVLVALQPHAGRRDDTHAGSNAIDLASRCVGRHQLGPRNEKYQ
jgi:hypothetical protein